MTPDRVRQLEALLTPDELGELNELMLADVEQYLWRPLPGPQTMAYESTADVIGYGGSAGGGKTDLAVGKALMQHHEILILRREATQLKGILRRIEGLLGDRDGYNGQDKTWRHAGPRDVTFEFGSCPNLGDETKHQGNPHDLLVFDEAANFLEQQVNFLLGWNRSTRQGMHSQALLTFNPPTSAEGRWIVRFFAPWIDKKFTGHGGKAKPGEIRYCVTVPQENETVRYEWVADDRPCIIKGGEICYDFDPADYAPEDIVTPQSRTFIPSRISDNPHLASTGYMRVLQAMPEPLRSQMLYGDFEAGMTDDPWQVIPTAWVEAAMARWTERHPKGEMLGMGVDVARGGKDSTTVAARHVGNWYANLAAYPGKETPDGPRTAGLVVGELRDESPIMIDVIGVGASPYDVLNGMGLPVYGINVSERSTATDKSGRLTFMNQRSQYWWQMREELDPANDTGICLPKDPILLAELCTPKWEMSGFTIKVESREDIVKRVGRSPDRATAVILARIPMPKVRAIKDLARAAQSVLNYDPMAGLR